MIFEPKIFNNIIFREEVKKYINEPDDNLNDLIRIAIIHAQFETIHLLLDGNGRIGRILIPLYLYEKKIISSPNFFISESLEKDKYKYYKLLNDTRVDTNEENEEIGSERWIEWIKFFINALIVQGKKNIKLIEDIDNLYNFTIDSARMLINNKNKFDLILSDLPLGLK